MSGADLGAGLPASVNPAPVGRPAHGRGALLAGWAMAAGIFRDFIWADLRDGVINLRGLGSAVRALVWLGFLLLILTIVAMLQGDVWRQAFPLLPLTQGIPGRGRLVPAALVPVSLFLVTLAWAFVLAGALRSHPLIRVGILLVWLLHGVGSLMNGGSSGVAALAVGLFSMLAIVAIFAFAPLARPRRVAELLALFLLVGANNAMSQWQGLQTWQLSGMPLMVTRVSFDMVGLGTLIMPLLLLIGMDVAAFTLTCAGWITGAVDARLPAWAPRALLLVVLPWRLWEAVADAIGQIQQGQPDRELVAFAFGLTVPILVGGVWLGVRALAPAPRPTPDRDALAAAAGRFAPPLVVAYTAPVLAVIILSGAALAVAVVGLFARAISGVQDDMIRALGVLSQSDVQFGWHLVVSVTALLGAIWLARRGQSTSALFVGIVAVLDLRRRLTVPGQTLDIVAGAGSGDHVGIWWAVIFAVLALVWVARRELTPARAGALAFLTLVTLLLRQTDFISNRFSPFVDSSGIGFIAFGIIWDALTIGAWANVGSRALPRVSRIFLYLGYVLLTVAVINWAVASHDLATVGRLTGEVSLVGLESYGKPLIYAIFAATLAAAFQGRRPEPVEAPT